MNLEHMRSYLTQYAVHGRIYIAFAVCSERRTFFFTENKVGSNF
jgi:hypothetical protein